jgi:hypothetical protein
VPRWPVAGPSEYRLLASNPATKVCKDNNTHIKKQNTQGNKNKHKIITQYTKDQLQLAAMHIGKATQEEESTQLGTDVKQACMFRLQITKITNCTLPERT